MAERTAITQITNIGVEAPGAPGTLVPAGRRLQALSIDPSVDAAVDMFRPSGQKFHSLQSLNQESVSADLSGKPTYTEIIYPLASVLTRATPTTATGVSTWEFSPANGADDAPATFTVEKGSGVRAHRFGYGLVTELGLSFGRDTIDLDGSMIGQLLEDDVALTATPDGLELIPVLPGHTRVFLDDTGAALGTTKLTRVISVDWTIGDRYNPAWFLDADVPSWATHVEGEPTVTATITMEADEQGMELLATMRTGETRFLRTEAIGPEIGETATNHRLALDLAGKVESIGGFGDEDGIYTIEYTLRAVYDDDWGNAVVATVVNGVGAL